MKKIATAVLGLTVSAFPIGPAQAAVPGTISYQGQLNNQAGVPATGTFNIMFRLYETAAGGTALWTEGQSLSVTNGVFSAQLGAVDPLPPSVFLKEALFLGVQVGSDQEMVPRQKLASTAFAHRAEVSKLRLRSNPSLFGDGSDGAFVGTGTHQLTRGKVYQFSTFDLQSGSTITATGGTSQAEPIVIRVSGSCNLAGLIDLAGAGMPASVDVPNTLRAGQAGLVTGGDNNPATGGGGGAGAGTCGAAGGSTSHGPGGEGGCWLFQAAFGVVAGYPGAGGGNGGNGLLPGGYVAAGGVGGAGGGSLLLFIGGDATITGTIRVEGTGGGNGASGGTRFGAAGGGGGGGGSVVIYHKGRLEDSAANYLLNGGNGGAGGGGGAGDAGAAGAAGGQGRVQAVEISGL